MFPTSVVIPAFRARDFIARSVGSVLVQTSGDWEVVVVSDDGVDYDEVLRSQGIRDGRIRFVSTGAVGTGPANARNVGLRAAEGPLVASLDADDRMEPEALAVLGPLALEHGVAYSCRRIVDHFTGEELPSYDRVMESGLVSLDDVLTSQIHSYAGVVFDSRRVGAHWPRSRELWEDVYFFVRCFDYVERVYYEAAPLYIYYRRDGSICNRPETADEYLEAAGTLLHRIASGDSLDIRRDEIREIYRRFLVRSRRIEASFREALAERRVVDFREFVARNRALFDSLDERLMTPVAGA